MGNPNLLVAHPDTLRIVFDSFLALSSHVQSINQACGLSLKNKIQNISRLLIPVVQATNTTPPHLQYCNDLPAGLLLPLLILYFFPSHSRQEWSLKWKSGYVIALKILQWLPGVLSSTGKPHQIWAQHFLPSSPPAFLYTHAVPVILVSLLLLGLNKPSLVSTLLFQAVCLLFPFPRSLWKWTPLDKPSPATLSRMALPSQDAPPPYLTWLSQPMLHVCLLGSLSVCPIRTSSPKGGLELCFAHSWHVAGGKHSANARWVNEHPPSCFHGSGLWSHWATSRLVLEGQMRMIHHP